MHLGRIVFILVALCFPTFATTIRIVDEPVFGGPKPPYGETPYTVDDPTTAASASFITAVGQLIVRINGSEDVIMYCVDLLTDIGLGITYNSTTRLPDPGAEQRVAWLYTNYGFARAGVPDSVNTDGEAVAMQLAMWDILHDNGTGPNAGNFIVLADAFPTTAALWQNYLNLSAGQQSTNAYIYENLTQGVPPREAQALIGPVPEPSTFAMLVVGGTALLAIRRRLRSSRN